VMRRIVPFYTWTRKNVPLQVEALLTNPGRAINRYFTAKRSLEMGTEEEDIVPSWFAEQGMIRLPWSIGGQQTYGNVDLPFRDVYEASDVTGQLMGMVNPMIKAPIEAWSGKQFFNDVPLREDYQPAPGTWTVIPGFMDALKVASKAPFLPWDEPIKQDGQWYVREKDAYLIGQYVPFLAQARRLVPTEEKYQNRVTTTFLSYLGGVNMRTNTPQDMEAEIFRRTRTLEGMINDMEDTGQIQKKATKPRRERRVTLASVLANVQPTGVAPVEEGEVPAYEG
jgi:hypothetical protein